MPAVQASELPGEAGQPAIVLVVAAVAGLIEQPFNQPVAGATTTGHASSTAGEEVSEVVHGRRRCG